MTVMGMVMVMGTGAGTRMGRDGQVGDGDDRDGPDATAESLPSRTSPRPPTLPPPCSDEAQFPLRATNCVRSGFKFSSAE